MGCAMGVVVTSAVHAFVVGRVESGRVVVGIEILFAEHVGVARAVANHGYADFASKVRYARERGRLAGPSAVMGHVHGLGQAVGRTGVPGLLLVAGAGGVVTSGNPAHRIGPVGRVMAGNEAPQRRWLVEPKRLVARESTHILAFDDPDLTRAVRFVRRHACDPIEVSDVLRVVHLSRSTLDNRFRTALGRTIHAEIQRVRIERAKQLLVDTELLVKQVAQRSGFASMQYMTTVFRQHTGRTPTQYRKREFNAE